MITVEDLNRRHLPTTGIIDSNLSVLAFRLCLFEKAYREARFLAEPLLVTVDSFYSVSGLRSEEEQRNLIKAGKSNAPKSKHLVGGASDLQDLDSELKNWARENPQVAQNIGLWFEHWTATPTWLHAQIMPPLSGNLWFYP